MTIARVAAMSLLLLALAGCTAPAEAPVPTPEATAASSAVPTATPSPTPAAQSIEVGVASIAILAADGSTLSTYSYFESASTVISALSALFGTEPSVEAVQPYEGIRYTRYDWNGFRLDDLEQDVVNPYYPDFRVVLVAASVGGIRLSVSGGLAVGDDAGAVLEAHADSLQSGTTAEGATVSSVHIEEQALPDYVSGPYNTSSSRWITVTAQDGVVWQLWAPTGGGPGI